MLRIDPKSIAFFGMLIIEGEQHSKKNLQIFVTIFSRTLSSSNVNINLKFILI